MSNTPQNPTPDSLVGWAVDFHKETEDLTRKAQFRAHVGLDNQDLCQEIRARQQDLFAFFELMKEVRSND